MVRTAVKRKANEDLHTRSNKIILKEIRKESELNKIEHPSLRLLRKLMYSVRRQQYSILLTSLEETFNYLNSEKIT